MFMSEYLIFREQTEADSVYLVCDVKEIFSFMKKVKIIYINGEYFSFVFVVDEVLVPIVKVLEIVNGNPLLVTSSSLLYICHKMK